MYHRDCLKSVQGRLQDAEGPVKELEDEQATVKKKIHDLEESLKTSRWMITRVKSASSLIRTTGSLNPEP